MVGKGLACRLLIQLIIDCVSVKTPLLLCSLPHLMTSPLVAHHIFWMTDVNIVAMYKYVTTYYCLLLIDYY